MDNKVTTDVGILDFSKAFDVMPHNKLLLKLDFYGVRSKTKDWIASFLMKRFQREVVNGNSSDWNPVLSGAPKVLSSDPIYSCYSSMTFMKIFPAPSGYLPMIV